MTLSFTVDASEASINGAQSRQIQITVSGVAPHDLVDALSTDELAAIVREIGDEACLQALGLQAVPVRPV